MDPFFLNRHLARVFFIALITGAASIVGKRR
jgi:hypothetical protein